MQPIVEEAMRARIALEAGPAPDVAAPPAVTKEEIPVAVDATELAVWDAPQGRRTTRAASAKVRALFQPEEEVSTAQAEANTEADAKDNEPHGCVYTCVCFLRCSKALLPVHIASVFAFLCSAMTLPRLLLHACRCVLLRAGCAVPSLLSVAGGYLHRAPSDLAWHGH